MSKSQKHPVIWTLILFLVVFLLLRGWIAGLLMEKAVQTDNVRIAKVAATISHASVNTVITSELMISRESALCRAMELHHKSVAVYLTNSGANINTSGDLGPSPLHLAAKWGDVDLVVLLLSKHADPNVVCSIGQTPLFDAVRYKRKQIIKVLIASGADINHIDSKGRTLIDYAIAEGDREITSLLRINGAKGKVPSILEYSAFGNVNGIRDELKRDPSLINLRGLHGWIPIHYASNSGQSAAAKLLIKRGTVIDMKALICAVSSGSTETVQILIGQGLDINKADDTHVTPLEMAIVNGNAKMVQYLLSAGANPSGRTSIGYTAEKFARSEGNADVIKVFETHKAGKTYTPLEEVPIHNHLP